jgi:hypothetical protein
METSELFDSINAGVIEERLHVMRRNIALNKKLIDLHGGLAPVVQRMSGKHCIIVGAGSSLEALTAELRKIHQRMDFVIIAADMAYAPLLKRKIIPHYVVSCETTPRDFFAGFDTSKSTLLAFSGVCSRIPREWKGEIFFYNWMMRNDPYEALWKEAGLHLGFAATGSTVTTQAVSIALGCGIRSLLLAGNDCGFSDMFYIRGSVRSFDFMLASSRIVPLTSQEMRACRRARHYCIQREKMFYTNHQFLASKRWLEALFADGKNVVYDCSVPGCSGKNIERLQFREYLTIADQLTGGRR